MIKVHISPDYLDKKDTGDGGIRRVSEAMIRHLPAFGVEHTRHVDEADIIVNHGAMLTWAKGKPIVNINHGLYWSRQSWGDAYQEVNEQVVESMARAVAHTAPSEWVARAIRRGGFWYPEVVYHGIDHRDFKPGDNNGYVLWNKARADAVSNPDDLMNAARVLRSVPFWTTIGRATENVKVIGVTDYARMKEIVANAGVYLATTRETFGIGTLEAMACGIPIAGFMWGGAGGNHQTGRDRIPGASRGFPRACRLYPALFSRAGKALRQLYGGCARTVELGTEGPTVRKYIQKGLCGLLRDGKTPCERDPDCL